MEFLRDNQSSAGEVHVMNRDFCTPRLLAERWGQAAAAALLPETKEVAGRPRSARPRSARARSAARSRADAEVASSNQDQGEGADSLLLQELELEQEQEQEQPVVGS